MNAIPVDNEVELRQLERRNAVALFTLTDRNRTYLREWLPWLDSVRVVGDTESFIDKTLHIFQETRALTCGIWYRDALVGVAGHNRIDWENRNCQLGYWLDAQYQGQGIVTRSCRSILQHAFTALDLHRVEIFTAVGNHRSAAVPVRLGFAVEGVRRQAEWLYDRFVDLTMHAMLRPTWQLRGTIASVTAPKRS